MLAFQTVEYYNKTLDLLRKLESTFSFIEESIPYNQKKYILEKILNSRKANDGNDYIYRVEIKKCDEGELLDYYQNCFTNFNNDFKFFEFYKLVTEVELEYNKICHEYNYTDMSVSNFISKLNNLSKLHETLVRGGNKNTDKVNFLKKRKR